MSSDLASLKKPKKLELAEKHLNKYLSELKRHFDFSDFQTIKLLENTLQKFKKEKQDKIISFFTQLIVKAKKFYYRKNK